MSEELETRIVGQCKSSGSLVEALNVLARHIEIDENVSDYWEVRNAHKLLEQSLQRLESIDNANPSEALECLRDIKAIGKDCLDECCNIWFDKVEQALLKQQEPKHYLKWEDLEFSKEYDTSFKVKLGDSIYTVTCSTQKFNNHIKYVAVETGLITYFIEELNKQFFNDLHLERVEE